MDIKFVWGGVAALAIMGLGALVVIETGAFNTSATSQHSRGVAWATHTTMIHSVAFRSLGLTPPKSFTQSDIQNGFHEYEKNCVVCHGGPAVDRAVWVRGMNPTPPYLIDVSRTWDEAELFFLVKNGVKMTGMPAWDGVLSDGAIWDEVAFLEALPNITPQAYLRMRKTDQTAQASPISNPLQLNAGPRRTGTGTIP